MPAADRFERRKAEAFVVREKRESRRRGVERGEIGVRYVRAPVYPVGDSACRDQLVDVDAWVGAVVAHDLEPGLRHACRQPAESVDELRDVAAIEQRPDEEDERRRVTDRPQPDVTQMRRDR